MRITSEHNGGGISLEERMRGGGDGDGGCASISGYRPRSRQRLCGFTEMQEKEKARLRESLTQSFSGSGGKVTKPGVILSLHDGTCCYSVKQ